VSAVYRVRQFIQAAGAWFRPAHVEESLLSHHLPVLAVDLFRAMPSQDRQHALIVFRTLQQRGYNDPDLLAAALLHDVGKGVPPGGGPRLLHRVAVVLMNALWPGLLERLGKEDLDGWRRPFYVQHHHAALGAELARQADCSPVTVDLVRRHEDPPDGGDDPLLVALQAADGTN
jgi:putative nucleotidyltransferase with HDIG domain